MERQLGKKAVQVADAPKLPPEGAYLWHYWLELHRARTGSGFAVNPLSYSEIEAWARLTDQAVTPWETRVIRAIDDTFMDAEVEASKRKK